VEELGLTVGLVGIAHWQAGFFMVRDGLLKGGFGYYRMNALSPFDSNGWSYVLRDLPGGEGDYEGFNYFGLGFLLLVLAAAPVVVRRARQIRLDFSYWPLAVVLLALTMFALSNKIGVGAREFIVPLPERLTDAAAVLRSSGRMFWPVFYVVLLVVVTSVATGYSQRPATLILAGGLLIQIVDTSAGWLPNRELFNRTGSVWATPLQSPFWDTAAPRYRAARHVLPGRPDNYVDIAYFAATHGMSTDAAYLSRVDKNALEAASDRALATVISGRYDHDSIYFLDDRYTRLAALTLRPDDALARIDGSLVVAPGWRSCVGCPPMTGQLSADDGLRLVSSGERISFARGGSGSQYLLGRWSSAEDWGTWSEGRTAEIIIPVRGQPTEQFTLAIDAKGVVAPKHPEHIVDVLINRKVVATLRFDETANGGWREIKLSRNMLWQHEDYSLLHLGFETRQPAKPSAIGVSNDNRQLGIGLSAAKVTWSTSGHGP